MANFGEIQSELAIAAGESVRRNAGNTAFEAFTPGSGVSDGDKGDITVTASGATWTIDNGVVTAAKTSITGTPDGTKFLRDDFTWQAGGSGAPTTSQYVTLATDATLTNERVLTGTSNQITITDGGAGTTVTLSTPQNIHTSATPQFSRIGLSQANAGNAYIELKTLTAGGVQGFRAEADTATNIQFSTFVTSDSFVRFTFLADGKQEWGSGALVADTNLYRSAADTLKTDDNFIVGTAGTVAGSAATIDGTQSLTNKTITDSTNNVMAKSLKSATTTVDVSAATAPSTGQVLMATSSTTATWQTPASGSGISIGLGQAQAMGLILI